MGEQSGEAVYRFDQLGWLQFERLCAELVALFADVSSSEWHRLPSGCALVLPEGVLVPGERRALDGPTLAVISWLRDAGTAQRLHVALTQALGEWGRLAPRSALVLTNVEVAEVLIGDVEVLVLGPRELTELVASSWSLRLRVPTVLGIGAAGLADPAVADRSTADVAAARALARVFVPTRAYAATIDVLERHHFVVLTGPPEMGKTAIARTIGLAALTGGWELHECIRPDDLWARFNRDRQQLFIADDAFGSTEYRPETAERWALELDRVLRAMGEHHWLIWTSRPAPFKAGLRRIHREHGVERFPQPAEVQVDAADLDVGEKALILFRHAKAAALSTDAVELVKAEGWPIVSHPHFTPERIRRFVDSRLLDLASQVGEARDIEAAVAAEIREPTQAMGASFKALSDQHRELLLALLDTPPGPVSERELVAAFRRHSEAGLGQQPSELVDRLTDHFLRVVDGRAVTWVHPSWRDLVIDELRNDSFRRERFLRASALDGLLLAVSTAGGEKGERLLPLIRDDRDWDALADRLAQLIPNLDEPELTRLFIALAEAQGATKGGDRAEIDHLARSALQLVARHWSHMRGAIAVGLLQSWLELGDGLPEAPPLPELAATWIELLPTQPVDIETQSELVRFDDWTMLCELLDDYVPDTLAAFGFPDQHRTVIAAFVDDVEAATREPASLQLAQRELMARILRRLNRLAVSNAMQAADLIARLLSVREEPELPRVYPRRPLSPELQRLLDEATPRPRSDEALVARVLRDL